MSTIYACSIMFGLPYKTFLERLPEEFDLDEMIYNGELDIGSIYYDSPRDKNIVGFVLQRTGSNVKFDTEEQSARLQELTEGHTLEGLAPVSYTHLTLPTNREV